MITHIITIYVRILLLRVWRLATYIWINLYLLVKLHWLRKPTFLFLAAKIQLFIAYLCRRLSVEVRFLSCLNLLWFLCEKVLINTFYKIRAWFNNRIVLLWLMNIFILFWLLLASSFKRIYFLICGCCLNSLVLFEWKRDCFLPTFKKYLVFLLCLIYQQLLNYRRYF